MKPFASWVLPGTCGEVLAVYVDGVELSRADWEAEGTRVHLRDPVEITPPPRTALTAIVWRSGGSHVVDARPAHAA